MPQKTFVIAVLFGLVSLSAVTAQEASPSTNLPFLKVDEYYVITFPETHHPFRKVKRAVTRTSANTPANWTITYETNVFRVKRLGRAGWVLLEHPKDIKQSAKFSTAVMKYVHASETVRQEIEKAIAAIDTQITWINLDHAIAISDPPNPSELKLEVNVSVKDN